MSNDPTRPLGSASATAANERNSYMTGGYFASRGPQFAPPRQGHAVEAYINGRTAMKAMADAIKSAQKFILITDWQMNFDVELDNRGDPDHPDRLSELLYHAMARGVDVRVLLYDSVEAAAYTHENENVEKLYRVQERLPDSALGSVQVALQNPASGREDYTNIFFSHHQKMLLVDGTVAFVGGLDFAHGRWDDGNFDVVCDPRIHVINDHYNNCLTKGRGANNEENLLSQDGLGRGLNDRPGFAGPYLPGLAVAVDRLKTMWEEGALLSEINSYVDKAGVNEVIWDRLVEKLADIPIDGYSEAAKVVRTLGKVLQSIKQFAIEADQKYDKAISAQVRAIDEARSGNLGSAVGYQLDAVGHLVGNPVTKFTNNMRELKAKVVRAAALVEEYTPVVVGKVGDYAEDPSRIRDDVNALLDKAQQAYDDFVIWLNTPIDRTQWLLDHRRQPRMPWQDIHLQLRGPAVFDMFRNFAYRWNATVVQNKAAAPYSDAMLWGANKVAGLFSKSSVPEQKSVIRGAELSALDAEWLNAMGGREALFGNVDAPGTAGGASVQIVRSSGKALHELENKGIGKFKLPTHYGRQAPGGKELPEDKPIQGVLDAMLHCIGSARAYIYIESQFLISNCTYGDAKGGGTLLADRLRGDGSGRKLSLGEKAVEKGAAAAAPVADAVLPGSPVKELTREQVGERSPAKNALVEALAERIGEAIKAGNDFHVYVVLPVHPEGSLFDAAVVKQQYWIQQSLLRGRDSLIRRICRQLVLKRKGLHYARGVQEEEILQELQDKTWERYLTILNLRSYGMLDDGQKQYVVTEQCYVHSKLMIVDDAVAIIGSANINDRSLMGNGDTEIAAVVVDGKTEQRDLGNGKMVVTRAFARNLRKELWRKHLGMGIEEWAPPELKRNGYSRQSEKLPHPPFTKRTSVPNISVDMFDQPAAEATWKAIKAHAESNSDIYEKVFQHVPRNSMGRYRDALQGFPRAGYVLDKQGKVKLNTEGQKTEKVTMFREPAALQPAYMRQPVRFNAQTGVTEDMGEHDVQKAHAALTGLVGFWVRMPLLWGHALTDPAPALPGDMIAVNDVLPERDNGMVLAAGPHRRSDGKEKEA